jgi:hypothetical protein
VPLGGVQLQESLGMELFPGRSLASRVGDADMPTIAVADTEESLVGTQQTPEC